MDGWPCMTVPLNNIHSYIQQFITNHVDKNKYNLFINVYIQQLLTKIKLKYVDSR